MLSDEPVLERMEQPIHAVRNSPSVQPRSMRFSWKRCVLTLCLSFSILSSSSYDNTGGPYDVTRILTSATTLDLAAYKAYSPLFLSYVPSLNHQPLRRIRLIGIVILHAGRRLLCRTV